MALQVVMWRSLPVPKCASAAVASPWKAHTAEDHVFSLLKLEPSKPRNQRRRCDDAGTYHS